MKKNVVLMMLSLSITATSIAQDQPQASKTEQTFNISAGYFKRDFSFDLGNGNRMQIQLSDIADLDKIINMDSLLHDFFVAIATLEDTLSDELTSKRIDYLADSAGRKKIRVQVYPQKSLSYFLQQGNLAALKLEQDTINIIGLVSYTAKYTLRKAFAATRYYQVSFFINQVSDLKKIPANTLNNKISAIQDKKDGKWTKTKDGRWHINSMGQDIYSKEQGGYIGSRGDYLEMRISVNAQNYKNYFVPSFSLGAAVILSNGFFKRDIGLFWEP
ncbi:MAG: hypothetical protein ABJA37_10150, partial [Ferruginibacter sp.]